MKIAVVYARYSCDQQTEQSIEGQLRVCEQYAKNNDIKILTHYIDRAMTGTNDNRPDFQKMIADSSKKEFDYILVYKIDRFSRNKYETAKYKKILKDNGVKLLSAMENIPDTPEGIILESLLEGMAEYYSAELAQKVRRGMKELRIKGQYQGGYIPYGYDLVNKKLVINEEQSKVIQEMYNRYANGVVVNQIIRDLTAKGCLNHGKPFNNSTVHGFLRKEAYSGIYRINGEVYENVYPQIVSRELFNRVQQRREMNLNGKGRLDNIYILRNKLVCGYCGKSISSDCAIRKNGQKICYYKCIGRKKYHNGCQKETLRQDYLEPFIIDCITTELEKEENIKLITQKLLEYQDSKEKRESVLTQLLMNKHQFEMQLENIMQAVEQGLLNRTTNQRIKDLEEKLDKVEEDILIEKSRISAKVTEEDIKKFFKNALKEESIVIINLLVKKIILYNNKVEIIFNTPFESPVNQGFSFLSKTKVFILPKGYAHCDYPTKMCVNYSF